MPNVFQIWSHDGLMANFVCVFCLSLSLSLLSLSLPPLFLSLSSLSLPLSFLSLSLSTRLSRQFHVQYHRVTFVDNFVHLFTWIRMKHVQYHHMTFADNFVHFFTWIWTRRVQYHHVTFADNFVHFCTWIWTRHVQKNNSQPLLSQSKWLIWIKYIITIIMHMNALHKPKLKIVQHV
jgi:hypothetical protein